MSKAVIFMGSEKDREHAEKMIAFWKDNNFGIKHEVRAMSAHKMAPDVLSAVKEFEKEENIVFIAVAGRSNALGPLLAGHSYFPVINCPPLSEKFDFADLLSSIRMPSNVPCTTIIEPENAALHAVKVLALNNHVLREKLAEYVESVREKIRESDDRIKKEFE